MRAIPFLFALVALAGLSFAVTGFGPGTANDCMYNAPIVINTPDYYQWQGYPGPMFESFGSPCISVATSDVVIDCSGETIDGSFSPAVVPGIWVQPGVDNVTIVNCTILQFNASNIFIGIPPGGAKVTNVVINNTILSWTAPLTSNADNIACVNGSGITIDYTNSGSPGAHYASQSGLGDGNAGPATCDDVAILNSDFDGNSDFGAFVMGDNFRAEGSSFDNNGMGGYGGADGAFIIGDNDYIRGCDFFSNAGNGLTIDDADGSQVLSSDFVYNGNNGLYLNTATGVTVDDNEMYYNGNYGIWAEDVTGSTFNDNWAEYNGYGLGIGTDTLAWNDNVDITNNYFNYNSIYGVELYDMSSMLLDGNEVEGNYIGVYMENVDPSTVSNNEINDHGAGYGIEAYDLDTVAFSDNYLEYNGLGIYISTSSLISNPDCTFDGNELYDNYGDGMYAEYMDNAVFTDNIFDDNDGDGAQLYWSYAVEIYGQNMFTDNGNNGLYLDTWCDDAVVYGNFFDNNDVGMMIYDSYNAEIYDNDFTYNDGSVGLYIQDCDTLSVHDNTVEYNFYGIYADPTTSLTLENNQVNYNTNIGVLFDSVYDSTVEGNTISYNDFEGIYMSSCDTIGIIGNTIEYNGVVAYGDGVYADFTDFLTFSGNDIRHNYGDGVNIGFCAFPIFEENNIYGNEYNGVTAGPVFEGDFSGNTLYDNGGSAYFLSAQDSDFTGETMYNNGWTHSNYCVEGSSFSGATFTDIEIYNSYGGFMLDDVDDATFTNVNGYTNEWDEFYLYNGCENAVFTNCHSWDGQNQFSFYFADSTATLTDCSSHDHGPGVYGLEVYDGSVIETDNFQIYGMADNWLYVDSTSTLDASVGDGLWMGWKADRGGGLWTTPISPASDVDLTSTNFLAESDFVSMDDADADTAGIRDEPATLTMIAHGSCSAATYYVDAGFPTSRDEILADGTEFTPATTSCDSGIATFAVDNFSSGYAVMPGGGDDDGAKSMSIVPPADCMVGEECIITVRAGGSGLPNVEVRVTTWDAGILRAYDMETDSAGEAAFTPEYEGRHEIRADRPGYVTEDDYFWVESGEEVPLPECEVDADCAAGYECTRGTCVLIPEEEPVEVPETECLTHEDCPEGLACVDGQCLETACISDEDCGEGYACVDYECQQTAAGEADQEAAAMGAIEDAQDAIDQASAEGRDTSEAEALLEEARAAYSAGDYDGAAQKAAEAENAALNAPMPAAPETPAEQPEEVQVGEGEQLPPEQPQEEFPWLWVLLVLIVGGAAVWYLFFRGGK